MKKKIQLHIDTKGFPKKPTENIGSIRNRLQKRTPTESYSIEKLIEKIETGHSVSPAIMGGTKASDWIKQELFMVDIDNDKEGFPIITPDEAVSICMKNNLPPVFYYHTFSSSSDIPRFRLAFIMDSIITVPIERHTIITKLMSLFNQSDTMCKDANRIFYGTNKPVAICDLSARIKFDDILRISPQELPPNAHPNMEEAKPDTELERLKREFDFFNYLKERNAPFRKTSHGAVFKNCEVCGHHDDLAWYKDSNTFYCFSANGEKGGSIIDYLMITEKITLKQAIDKFKYELCGLEKPFDEVILDRFKELSVEWNYTIDDKGISKLFSDFHKEKFRYNVNAKEWYYFDGKIWIEDTGAMMVMRHVKTFANTLYFYSGSIKNEDKRKAWVKYVNGLGEHRKRETLIRDARDNYCVYQSDFDAHVNLLNCKNGTLNLETFELEKHNPNDLLSRMANVNYNPKAKAPIFEKFIDEIMENNVEKTNYLQKALGYALTPDTSLETSFILYGPSTRNGKSTLIETIAYMLGNSKGYALSMEPNVLASVRNKDSRQANPEIARLKDCRFLSVSELPQRMSLDVALMKKLLGGDTIVARHLHKENFEFVPYFKLFFNTNKLPIITDNTLFTSGRINVIEFNRHFEPEEQDRTLKIKLRTNGELSGILNWCLEGLKQFRKEGLVPPHDVVNATKNFQNNYNKISMFLSECLEKSNENIMMKTLYETYELWCSKNEYACESKSTFFGELRKRNFCADSGRVDGRTAQNVVKNHRIKPRFRNSLIF